MQRSWALVGLIGLLLAVSVHADPGTIKTNDGQTITGDITIAGDKVTVVRKGITITLSRADIRTISYAASVDEEYRRRHEKLTPYDVPGRLELAQWLVENHQYARAEDVLAEAQALQPRNPQVQEMLRIVRRESELDNKQARQRAPMQIATITEGAGPAATNPSGAAATRPAATQPSRALLPDEINYIRQEEWRQGDQVSVRFLDDVKRNFLAQQKRDPGAIDPTTFNRLTAAQQASLIIKTDQDRHSTQLRHDVILGDPPVMRQFRTVQRSLLAACANCHSPDKPSGDFVLRWPATTDADMYTNFLILQKYSDKIGDRTYRMIDRERPADSLLLQFALPPNMASPPHPAAQNYKGIVHTTSDNRLRTVADWLSSLNPVVPDYSIIDVGGPGPTSRPAQGK